MVSSDWWTTDYVSDRYLTPMSQLEGEYPGVVFVYMTSPSPYPDRFTIMRDDANIKANNSFVRSYCIANNKVLYDFGDIEHYNPDGSFFEFAADSCDYYASATGPLLGNWATEWQNSHVLGVDWYQSDIQYSTHSTCNTNLKAYAAWSVFAQIADRMSGNRPPVAANDTYTTSEDTALCGGRAGRAGQRHRPRRGPSHGGPGGPAKPRQSDAEHGWLVHVYPGGEL